MLLRLDYKHLADRNFRVETEIPMPAGDRLDILAQDKTNHNLLIEVKIEKPIRGIGQLFGYRVGLESSLSLVLAVSEKCWKKSPRSSAQFLCRACNDAKIEFWVVKAGGTSQNQ